MQQRMAVSEKRCEDTFVISNFTRGRINSTYIPYFQTDVQLLRVTNSPEREKISGVKNANATRRHVV